MNGEAPPATADVQQPHSRFQVELARNQIELRELRLLKRLRAPGEDRAAVGHRLVQKECKEVVADVVVIAHSGGITLDAVALAAQDELEARTTRNPPWHSGRNEGGAEANTVATAHWRRLPGVDHGERRVKVVDRKRAIDIGTAQSERSGSAKEMRERRRPSHEERRRICGGRTHGSTIPEAHVERPRRQQALKLSAEGSTRANQCHGRTIADGDQPRVLA